MADFALWARRRETGIDLKPGAFMSPTTAIGRAGMSWRWNRRPLAGRLGLHGNGILLDRHGDGVVDGVDSEAETEQAAEGLAPDRQKAFPAFSRDWPRI